MGNYINTESTSSPVNSTWINQKILYGSKEKIGLNFINAWVFFLSLKVSRMKRYATDFINEPSEVRKSTIAQILTWGPEALRKMIDSGFLSRVASYVHGWFLKCAFTPGHK